MPTTEERLAALEAKMAQLTDTRPTTYYTHQYSGEEIDAAVGRALTGGALDTSVTNVSNQLGTFTRPNLLDNWYFGNPVDQKKGKIIQSGVNIYTDSTLKTLIGPAAYACPVVELTSTYAKVQDAKNTGSYYYAAPADVVRGYTGNGYTVDRWMIGAGSSGTLSLADSGLKLARTDGVMYLAHRILKTQIPEGNVLTYSVLTTSGLFFTSFVVKNDTYHEQIVGGGISLGWNYTPAEMVEFTLVNNTVNSDVTVLAAKLELGPTQTLAHQENGNWVLNEVPEYGEQLRRCLRHDYIIWSDTQPCPIGMGTAYSDNSVVADIQLPEYMRTNPAITISGYVQIRFSATQNFSVSTVENYGFSGDKVQLYFSGLSGLTPGQSCDLYTQAGSRIEFNANL